MRAVIRSKFGAREGAKREGRKGRRGARDRETERQRDRDRETERERETETERQRELIDSNISLKNNHIHTILPQIHISSHIIMYMGRLY